MILCQLWLTKVHVHNYWDEAYMKIRKGPYRQRISFVLLGGAPKSDESDSNSLEAENSEIEGIFTDDSSDDAVELYAIEAIPKGKIPPQKTISCKTNKR